jgi:hypothetical protein
MQSRTTMQSPSHVSIKKPLMKSISPTVGLGKATSSILQFESKITLTNVNTNMNSLNQTDEKFNE